MTVKVERLGNQQQAKINAIIETGSGADMFICADTDLYLYGDKLLDVSAVAKDIDTAWHGWYDVAKKACIVKGIWRGLMLGQAPDAWNWRPGLFQGRRNQRVSRYLRRSSRRRQGAQDLRQANGHDPRARRRRRALDETRSSGPLAGPSFPRTGAR